MSWNDDISLKFNFDYFYYPKSIIWGYIFSLFILSISGVDSAIGLALLYNAIQLQSKAIDLDFISNLKGWDIYIYIFLLFGIRPWY